MGKQTAARISFIGLNNPDTPHRGSDGAKTVEPINQPSADGGNNLTYDNEGNPYLWINDTDLEPAA